MEDIKLSEILEQLKSMDAKIDILLKKDAWELDKINTLLAGRPITDYIDD